MQNFKTLRQPLLGELAMSPERGEKEEKKMPFIVATYVYASSQGQRTHSARTNISIQIDIVFKILVFILRLYLNVVYINIGLLLFKLYFFSSKLYFEQCISM
jgi:hypothetical protein